VVGGLKSISPDDYGRSAASPASGSSGSGSSAASEVKALFEWLNGLLGTAIPASADALSKMVKADSTLLCRLMARADPNSLDERAMNTEDLDDPENVLENHTLFLLCAQSIGCAVTDVEPEDLAAGKVDGLMTILRIIRRNTVRTAVPVEAAVTPLRSHSSSEALAPAAGSAPGSGERKRPVSWAPQQSAAPRTPTQGAPAPAKTGHNRKQLALDWCQEMAGDLCEIKDFTKSFSDGLAFCAIMHGLFPELVAWEELSAENPRENFELAFEVAEENGQPPLLDVDDMVSMEVPDARSVMTYVFELFRKFGPGGIYEPASRKQSASADIPELPEEEEEAEEN
jgi:hypothetical protein